MSAHFQLVSAVHLFLLRGHQLLVLRRYQTGYADGDYSVVAGHLEGNETVTAAAVREAREEIGVELAPDDVRVVGVMHRRSTDERVDWFVTCERWSGEIRNAEPAKCNDLRWVDLQALPRNTIPYIRRAIDNFLSGRWYDSYGWS
jgi:8-oxo-dGTP diphosphatase